MFGQLNIFNIICFLQTTMHMLILSLVLLGAVHVTPKSFLVETVDTGKWRSLVSEGGGKCIPPHPHSILDPRYMRPKKITRSTFFCTYFIPLVHLEIFAILPEISKQPQMVDNVELNTFHGLFFINLTLTNLS